MKSDLKYLIECYDAALKISDDKIIDYIFLENLEHGVCRKLGYNKNHQNISSRGVRFIKKNKQMFDERLLSCGTGYWFSTPMNYSDTYRIRKTLEARKTVLEEILKTL